MHDEMLSFFIFPINPGLGIGDPELDGPRNKPKA